MKAWRKVGRKQADENPQIIWPKWALMSPLLVAMYKRAGIQA